MLKGIVIISGLLMTQTACADDVTKTTTTTTTTVAPATPVTAPAPTQSVPVTTTTTVVPATTTTPASASMPVTQQPLVGGYNPIDVSDAGVQKAASFAVSQMQQGSLVKVVSAQMQVVAGTNYKLLLLMDQNGVNYQYNVVVFSPLPNTNQPMQLTTVQAMGRVVEAQ